MPIEQLLLNHEVYPQLNLLYQDVFLQDLDLICDIQELVGSSTMVYGLENSKVIRWLRAKVEQTIESLDQSPLMQAYFTKTNPSSITGEKHKICSALRLLSEYIEHEWMELLKSEYG
jgi:hypothetical protein